MPVLILEEESTKKVDTEEAVVELSDIEASEEEKSLEFCTLPDELQSALKLLKKRRLAVRGVGNIDPIICPLAYAYVLKATQTWDELFCISRWRLQRRGWIEEMYNSFISFHDGFGIFNGTSSRARHSFLYSFLTN